LSAYFTPLIAIRQSIFLFNFPLENSAFNAAQGEEEFSPKPVNEK
jgi:hypothetical protein